MSLPGLPPENPEPASSDPIVRFLPSCQWRTLHRVSCNATPNEAYRALVLAPVRHPVLTILLGARGLSAKGSLKEFFIDNGFVVLEESPPLRFVVGFVGRPWRVDGRVRKVQDLDEWKGAVEAGDVRVVSMFAVSETVSKHVHLTTETRIHAQSPSARQKFALYWTFIKPFSGIVRRLWLQSAARSVGRIKP